MLVKSTLSIKYYTKRVKFLEINTKTNHSFNKTAIGSDDCFDTQLEARTGSNYMITVQILHCCCDGLPQRVQTVVRMLVANPLNYALNEKVERVQVWATRRPEVRGQDHVEVMYLIDNERHGQCSPMPSPPSRHMAHQQQLPPCRASQLLEGPLSRSLH